jgi:hypothetical protein
MSAAPRTNGLSSSGQHAGKRTLSLSMSAAETQAALSAAQGGNGTGGPGKEAGLHPLKHRCVRPSARRLSRARTGDRPPRMVILSDASAPLVLPLSLPHPLDLVVSLSQRLSSDRVLACARRTCSWVFWFLNRHVGEKIASPSQYEESIKKVGGFASVRPSFLAVRSALLRHGVKAPRRLLSRGPSTPASRQRAERLTSLPLPHTCFFFALSFAPRTSRALPPSYLPTWSPTQIESFWTIYSHLHSPSALPPVTDILLFTSQIRRPIWEEVPKGAKFTIRLRKGLSDRLWEAAVLAAVGDQFEEQDGVVGVVLSVRAQEDVISVWTERSYTDSGARVKYVSSPYAGGRAQGGEGAKCSALLRSVIDFAGQPVAPRRAAHVPSETPKADRWFRPTPLTRDTIYRLLSLPPSTTVDYKLNVECVLSLHSADADCLPLAPLTVPGPPVPRLLLLSAASSSRRPDQHPTALFREPTASRTRREAARVRRVTGSSASTRTAATAGTAGATHTASGLATATDGTSSSSSSSRSRLGAS